MRCSIKALTVGIFKKWNEYNLLVALPRRCGTQDYQFKFLCCLNAHTKQFVKLRSEKQKSSWLPTCEYLHHIIAVERETCLGAVLLHLLQYFSL